MYCHLHLAKDRISYRNYVSWLAFALVGLQIPERVVSYGPEQAESSSMRPSVLLLDMCLTPGYCSKDNVRFHCR